MVNEVNGLINIANKYIAVNILTFSTLHFADENI